jgi:hypothetical protein
MCKILSCNTLLISKILLVDRPYLDQFIMHDRLEMESPELPTMANLGRQMIAQIRTCCISDVISSR